MHFTLIPITLALALPAFASPVETVEKRTAVDFLNPTDGGGSWLDMAAPPLGEPLNVVVSGLSSPELLDLSSGVFLKYAEAIGFDTECLGLHLGGPQSANLGDGRGYVNQTEELRESYGVDGSIGTCLETLEGGNHFRVFPQAGTNAIFLAVSQEQDLENSHNIVPNGYDVGRDALVAGAVGKTTYFDLLEFKTYTFETTAVNMTGLIAPGSNGVNHGIAQDGIVTLLTVTYST
ncbi:hypothetical protein HMN09_00746200 [Mycena chlorophos]|uniref:Secreted protein n=1 Tax=Mycena chlorophos TaxID=658473 RepID=A0A8H6SXV9_MYCCL|nr:hypothetical protein HMN09_00746200 [Mycena chlorophos]